MKTIKAVGEKIFAEFRPKPVNSSLILPEGYKQDLDDVAIVVSVGDEVKEVKPGDNIVFNPAAAMLITVLEKQYLLITEKAVLCIVKD